MSISTRWMLAAVGGIALPLSALAQPAGGDSVTIYGFLKADVERVSVSGAPGMSMSRLSNNLSVLGFRVRGSWERLGYEPAPGQSLQRNAWQIAVTHQLGERQELALSYVKANPARGNTTKQVGGIGIPGTDSGASQISLGYTYRLSRRTDLWAAYTRITNGATAAYNLPANGISGLKPGQNPSGVGLGITHRF